MNIGRRSPISRTSVSHRPCRFVSHMRRRTHVAATRLAARLIARRGHGPAGRRSARRAPPQASTDRSRPVARTTCSSATASISPRGERRTGRCARSGRVGTTAAASPPPWRCAGETPSWARGRAGGARAQRNRKAVSPSTQPAWPSRRPRSSTGWKSPAGESSRRFTHNRRRSGCTIRATGGRLAFAGMPVEIGWSTVCTARRRCAGV